jgi:hypothetical protein
MKWRIPIYIAFAGVILFLFFTRDNDSPKNNPLSNISKNIMVKTKTVMIEGFPISTMAEDDTFYVSGELSIEGEGDSAQWADEERAAKAFVNVVLMGAGYICSPKDSSEFVMHVDGQMKNGCYKLVFEKGGARLKEDSEGNPTYIKSPADDFKRTFRILKIVRKPE